MGPVSAQIVKTILKALAVDMPGPLNPVSPQTVTDFVSDRYPLPGG